MTAEYVCMYCRCGRDSECDDRACTCCFGVPGELTPGLTVICAYSYEAAKNFADRRRWPPHSWVYADERRLRGTHVDRAVYLHGFADRRDYVEIRALVAQRIAMSSALTATSAHAAAELVAAGFDPESVMDAMSLPPIPLGDAE